MQVSPHNTDCGGTPPHAFDGLETARLRLRMFTEGDLDELCLITRDPEVMRHIAHGRALTRDETEFNLNSIINGFRRRGFGRWAVVERDGGALLGYCGLSMAQGEEGVGVEIAYLLSRGAWGRGIATEAGSACLRYGFETLGCECISGLTRHENARSRRVMERLGMRFRRDGHYYGYSCVCYSITRDEWRPDGSAYRVVR